MNLFHLQLRTLTTAVIQCEIERQEELDRAREKSEAMKAAQLKRLGNNPTKVQRKAAAREKTYSDILNALKGGSLSSNGIGKLLFCHRSYSLMRLVELEEKGLVERIGSKQDTLWRLK